MAGEERIVDQICVSSSELSDYDSDDEMSTPTVVSEVVSTSSKTVGGTSKNSTTSRSLLSVLQRPSYSDLCRKRTI